MQNQQIASMAARETSTNAAGAITQEAFEHSLLPAVSVRIPDLLRLTPDYRDSEVARVHHADDGQHPIPSSAVVSPPPLVELTSISPSTQSDTRDVGGGIVT